MSLKAPSLIGTEDYSWGSGRAYPPTETQWNLIKFIEDNLDVRFRGNSSRQAYKFIGDYHKKAEEAAGIYRG